MHAFMDLDDDDKVDANEDVEPLSYPFTTYPGLGCISTGPCSWDGSANTKLANRFQNAVQAFYLANLLPRPPGAAADLASTASRAATRSSCRPTTARARPSPNLNNANMYTPPDGQSPIMQMYLWTGAYRRDERRRRRVDRLPRVHARADEPARHRRRRRGRAELRPGGRDGRGLERLLRQGLPRLAVAVDRHGRAGRGPAWATTPTVPARTSIRNQGLDCPVGVTSEPMLLPGPRAGRPRRVHLRRLRQDRRRARGPRRRRDLGRDAVGPAHRARRRRTPCG